MERFKGKKVLITGAGQGVGKKTAAMFAKEGASVFLSDINSNILKDTEAELKESGFDIREAMVKEFGTIDILVNNAGVSLTKNMFELNEKDWDRVLNVNIKGTFFVLKAVAEKMIASGNGGSIVNISSIAGLSGRPLFLAYAASKAAVINITKSAALELAKYKIRVNSIAPGTIDTPMWEEISSSVSKINNLKNEDVKNSQIDKIPLKRLAKPEDISSTILYLCSEDAEYITGQSINVCGGLSIV